MTQRQELYFKSQPMPKYSKGEEIFNFASHAFGGAFMVIALFIFGYLSIKTDQDARGTLGLMIYCLCAICLYTMSSVYHGLGKDKISKKIFRIIDHCTIYLLIAGTYTPICAIAFKGTWQGSLVLILEWASAIVGIIINAFWLNKKIVIVISMLLYLVSGWCIVCVPGAVSMLTNLEFTYILVGGLLYTFGVIFYAAGSKQKWSHSIFHVFVVLGTIVQLFGIYYMVIR